MSVIEIKREAGDKTKGFTLQKQRALILFFDEIKTNPNAHINVAIEYKGDVFLQNEKGFYIEEQKNYEETSTFSFNSYQILNTLVYFLEIWIKENKSESVKFGFYSTNKIAKENNTDSTRSLSITLPEKAILELIVNKDYSAQYLLDAIRKYLINTYNQQYKINIESEIDDTSLKSFLDIIDWNFEQDNEKNIEQIVVAKLKESEFNSNFLKQDFQIYFVYAALMLALEKKQDETDKLLKFLTKSEVENFFLKISQGQLLDRRAYKYLEGNYISEKLDDFKAASHHLLNWYSFIDKNEKVHIERGITTQLLNWIQNPLTNGEKPIALLVGDAGAGKTVVLKDLYNKLLEIGIPVLGIKADKLTATSISDLEDKLDLREPISDIFKIIVHSNKNIVIIIDQIDALSQSLSSNREFLNTYSLLIEKLSNITGVRVVVSTRTFDLNYDPTIRTLKKNVNFQLGALSIEEVRLVFKELNIDVNINDKLFQTLKIPHHLRVFCEIYSSALSLDGIQELQDLYDELWKIKIALIPTNHEIDTNECIKLIYEIADQMSALNSITIKENSFLSNTKEINYLISNNIIVRDGKELQFFHQTFFDYVYARNFVENKKKIAFYVLENKQSLHIRSSIKMILAYLRIENEKQYVNDITFLLNSNKIRFHIKLLVINLIGYNKYPTQNEVRIAQDIILTNDKLRTCFIESVFGEKWVKFLIEQQVFDKLIDGQLSAIERFKLFFQSKGSLPKSKERKRDLAYISFYRTLPDSRKAATIYLLKTSFILDVRSIIRYLYFLKIWDFQNCFLLYKKYRQNIKEDVFSFTHILEDILPYNINWVITEYEAYLIELLEKTDEQNRNYQIDDRVGKLFEEISKQNKKLAFDLGLRIIKVIIEKNIYVVNENELHYDSAFAMYKYPDSHYQVKDNIYAEVIKILETPDLESDQIFKEFFYSHYKSNSVSLLQIIAIALCAKPQFTNEIVAFIEDINSRNGFYIEMNFHFHIRKLLEKSYPYFDQPQKDTINKILLNISYKYELEIYTTDTDKKAHSLKRYGKQKYRYINAIPASELNNQTTLIKVYQELKRKFGNLDKEKEPMRLIGKAVEAPLTNTAYVNMDCLQWEQTFIKYNSEDIFAYEGGGLSQHSNAFSDMVKIHPDKFYPFIERLINEDKVHHDYLVKGLEGLKEARFDPARLVLLFKKLISLNINATNLLYLVWLTDYFIANSVIDEEIFNFLTIQASNNIDSRDHIDDSDILFTGNNTIKGAAVMRIINCNYDPNFNKRIFEFLESIDIKDSLSVNAILLYHIAYLIQSDPKRTLLLFIKIIENADEKLVKASIRSLQYLVHNDFKMLSKYIIQWLHYENVQEELAGILTWCWIRGYDGSLKILNTLYRLSPKARAISIQIAYENIFDDDLNTKQKCEKIFIRFLNDTSSEVVHRYDVMFLFIGKKESTFNQWLPYIWKYSKSKVVKKNPHYYLDYILKNIVYDPKVCLELVFDYKSYSRPNISSGPYYSDEPLKIVLSCYNVFNNNNDQKYLERSIQLFDEMLKVDYLREKAYSALDAVEK